MADPVMYFRALSDRKRLSILEYLALHEHVPVSQLSVEFRLSQPLMSWHLRVLRRIGVVSTLRTGRQVLCSLNRPQLRAYQQQIETMFQLTNLERDSEASSQADSPSNTVTSPLPTKQ